VQAGLEHARRRSHAQRMAWLGGTVAVAASLLVMAVLSPLWSDSGRGPSSAEAASADPAALTREPGQPDATMGPLRVELAGRTLELVEGRATIEVVGHDAAVRLHTGVAAWIGADGQRTQIEVEQLEGAAGEHSVASAAELAREADRLLAANEREQAITILRRLVEIYPHATQARVAVLDLARLLGEVGRARAARCAYELYLDRWPDSSVTAEVEAQLARLAEVECRGLDPQ
jgi:hypothetical protein